MSIAGAYSAWAANYDTDRNLTRDLDRDVTCEVIGSGSFPVVVEAGCGTGKNTRYFSQVAGQVYALDFSEGMLDVARRHVQAPNVRFFQVDLSTDWPCPLGVADLVSFNLVLEHIEDIGGVLRRASGVLRLGGTVFVSELHPFRQYQHSQARFVGPDGIETRVPAYTHNISEYLGAARACGLHLVRFDEWWHVEDSRYGVPRIASFVFQRR